MMTAAEFHQGLLSLYKALISSASCEKWRFNLVSRAPLLRRKAYL